MFSSSSSLFPDPPEPPRSPTPDQSNPDLTATIAAAIRASDQHRITFAQFMELALYHPQHGYYASNQATIGVQGDFVTSPHLSRDFGELLAIQFQDLWDILGRPDPFTLVEMGAGQGLLAVDILRYLARHHPDCAATVDYRIVEAAPGMAAAQRSLLSSLTLPVRSLTWCDWADIPVNSIVGCCFSNELVDALPVHRVTVQGGELRELYVTLAAADRVEFQDQIGDLSTPELADYFKLVDVEMPAPNYPDGYTTEVNLAGLDWLRTVSDRLRSGYLLTIDYGYPASRYYGTSRAQGTLQCYHQHAHHNDPYRHIGRQDITAHVDFTALERQGDRCGLTKLGATQQGLFLMALGLGDRLNQLAQIQATDTETLNAAIQRRQVLHDLMNPMGLGNFGVLLQAKGVAADPQRLPQGFVVPPFGSL